MKRKALSSQSHAPEKIGDILWGVLRKKGIEPALKEQQILRDWSRMVGENIAEHTEACRIENHVLFVKVKSAVWRNELVYLKQDILKKVNGFMGKPILQDIIFTSHS